MSLPQSVYNLFKKETVKEAGVLSGIADAVKSVPWKTVGQAAEVGALGGLAASVPYLTTVGAAAKLKQQSDAIIPEAVQKLQDLYNKAENQDVKIFIGDLLSKLQSGDAGVQQVVASAVLHQ